MIERSGAESESGSIPLTNRSGYGIQQAQKHVVPVDSDPDSDSDPQHCTVERSRYSYSKMGKARHNTHWGILFTRCTGNRACKGHWLEILYITYLLHWSTSTYLLLWYGCFPSEVLLMTNGTAQSLHISIPRYHVHLLLLSFVFSWMTQSQST